MKNTLVLAAALAAFTFAAGAGFAAEDTKTRMTGTQMTDLLKAGKTLQVSGPGGKVFTGTLVLTADGKGTGETKSEDGKTTTKIEGTWRVKKDRFCHTWKGVDTAEVCEGWVVIEPTKVSAISKKKEVAIYWWQ
jgi:hypothetical protein